MTLDATKQVPSIVGDYVVIEKVAEGGMGTVYRGRHRESGQIVAIKIVPPHLVNNAVLQKRFENEFRAASKLQHANVVRALDFGMLGQRAYLVMEFVEGESLGQRLERVGRMSEADAVRVIAQTAQGLHHAHKHGLIHRDVKPDNIMLTADGGAKLADLGLVKEMDTDINLTRTGRGLGTPHFMAPEQFRDAKNADVRCDIYSLGATLYQMVTGELPFRSLGPLDAWMKKVNNELTPARKLVPELSERVDWAIRRAMHSDPAQRPNSCREFIEDLTGRSSRKTKPLDSAAQGQDIWYLVYRDEDGAPHTVKGTTSGIRRSLKEGLLGDAGNVLICRTKTGPFEPVRSVTEFRDVVPAPPPAALLDTVPAAALSVNTPPERPLASASKADVPHIRLEVGGSSTREWLKLTLVALVAMAAGMLVFYLLNLKH